MAADGTLTASSPRWFRHAPLAAYGSVYTTHTCEECDIRHTRIAWLKEPPLQCPLAPLGPPPPIYLRIPSARRNPRGEGGRGAMVDHSSAWGSSPEVSLGPAFRL